MQKLCEKNIDTFMVPWTRKLHWCPRHSWW